MILAANNSYSGNTTIDTGATLQIGNGGMTGSIGTSPSVNDNGTLAFNRSDNITFAAPISGSGSVTQAGAGTVILTGNNSYVNTTINPGSTLQIDNGGTTGTIGSGTIVDNGTLIFDRSDDQSVGNIISGAGSVQYIGGDNVTVSGASTYTGNTLVGAGTTVKPTTAAGALGSVTSTGVITVNGGTIDITGFGTNALGARVIKIAGNGVGGQGALLSNAGVNQTTAFSKVTLTADATIGVGTVSTATPSRFDLRNNTSSSISAPIR